MRLVALLKRRPGTSRDDFLRHWREVHGPLVRSRLGGHLVAYEQHPALPGQDWDGAAVLSFASQEAFDAFLADPAYASEVLPDEERFLDREAVTFVVAGASVSIV